MSNRETLIEKARKPSREGKAYLRRRFSDDVAAISGLSWLGADQDAVRGQVKIWSSNSDLRSLVNQQANGSFELLQKLRKKENFPRIEEWDRQETGYSPFLNVIFVDQELEIGDRFFVFIFHEIIHYAQSIGLKLDCAGNRGGDASLTEYLVCDVAALIGSYLLFTLAGCSSIFLRKEVGKMIHKHCNEYSKVSKPGENLEDAIIAVATHDCIRCIDWLLRD